MIYEVIAPTQPKVPILVSVPHSGTDFPEEIKQQYKPAQLASLEDTDWFVDKLYDFVSELGVTIIKAKYSRWVIDLNRNLNNKALYQDGRVITEIVTRTNFLGETIYKDNAYPDVSEIQRRVDLYYQPYHQKIQEILDSFKVQYGKALLYDAHSIKKHVPSIRKEAFPDFVLGTNQEKSASQELIQIAIETLSKTAYSFSHNSPFRGGAITRSFGKPEKGYHAIQLERSKSIYMDDNEKNYSPERADKLKKVLKSMFIKFINILK